MLATVLLVVLMVVPGAPAANRRGPVTSTPPAISGVPEELRTLTASTGTWKNSPTSYGYQWQRCDAMGGACTDVAGAAAKTYSLAFSDVGSTIRVRVTATNAYGSSSATSAATGVVAAVSLTLPVRAAFYYAWYPEGWSQTPKFTPSLGFYDTSDTTLIKKHIAAMQYARIRAGIYSWGGLDNKTNLATQRLPTYLSASQGTGFKWAVYHEMEGYSNPSVASIQSDLSYIQSNYTTSSSYLRVAGRPVVFVYSSPGDGCDMAARWNAANTIGAYVVLSTPWVDNQPELASLEPYDATYTGAVRVAAGDLDGDGKAEIVTAPGQGVEPRITVSSADGSRKSSFVATDVGTKGAYVAVGDVAGDVRPEIVVGSGDGTRIGIFSYEAGVATQIASFNPGLANGARVAIGDVTGDAKNEIVASTGAGTTPEVAIFGTDGSRVGGFFPYDAAFQTGVHVAVGDVTADGRADIVLGAANGSRTEARVVDASGISLVPPFETYPGFGGAFTVAVADTDGDGEGDVVTGAAGGPHVRTFTLRLGRASGLGSFFAYDSGTRGQVSVAAADVAGEGTADIVVGSAPGQPPRAKVFGNVRDCADQPDAWHEYLVTASGEVGFGRDAFTIAPGFWRWDEAAPSLPRDPSRWLANVASLNASQADWQLVISFNEWTESTSVESAVEWSTASGHGWYLDALRGVATASSSSGARTTAAPAAAAAFPVGHKAKGAAHRP